MVTLTAEGSQVTLVVLSYNHAPFVEQALMSVAAQCRLPARLIVVDDCSSDSSRIVIRNWLDGKSGDVVELYHDENRGLPASLNEALSYVETEYLAVLADDDWMMSERLQRQEDVFISKGRDYAVVHSDMVRVDMDGVPIGPPDSAIYGSPQDESYFITGLTHFSVFSATAMYRVSGLRSIGGFDEAIPMEDIDIFLQLARYFKIAYVSEVLVSKRVLADSMSMSADFFGFRAARLYAVMKHLDIPDPVLNRRVGEVTVKLASQLYLEGRAPRDSAVDIRKGLAANASMRGAILFILASARIPGRTAASGFNILFRQRQRLSRTLGRMQARLG